MPWPHGGVGAAGICGGCWGGVTSCGAGVAPKGEGVAQEFDPSVRSSTKPGGADGTGGRSTTVAASDGKARVPGSDSTETAAPECVHEGRGGGGRAGPPGALPGGAGGGCTGSPRTGVSNLGGSCAPRAGASTARRLMRSGILSGSLYALRTLLKVSTEARPGVFAAGISWFLGSSPRRPLLRATSSGSTSARSSSLMFMSAGRSLTKSPVAGGASDSWSIALVSASGSRVSAVLIASRTLVFKVRCPRARASRAVGVAIRPSAIAAAICALVIFDRAKKPGFRARSSSGTD